MQSHDNIKFMLTGFRADALKVVYVSEQKNNKLRIIMNHQQLSATLLVLESIPDFDFFLLFTAELASTDTNTNSIAVVMIKTLFIFYTKSSFCRLFNWLHLCLYGIP